VRANTVEVIEEQNIRGCEQKIVQLLEDSENRVKVNAAKYLVKNGYQQAFLTLRSMLVSPEVWLRDSVIFALGEIGDQASLTLLKAALKDPNQGIRLSVLKALARINNNTSRQVLKAACGDPDSVVAQVAGSLFDKIKDTPMREETKPPVFPVKTEATPLQGAPQKVDGARVPPAFSAPATPAAPTAPAHHKPVMPASPRSVETPASAAGLPGLDDLAGSALPKAPAAPVAQKPAPSSPPSMPQRPAASGYAMKPPASGLKPPSPLPVQSSGVAVPRQTPVPVTVPADSQLNKGGAAVPAFANPRSAEIYARLCSEDINEQRTGARDIAFVMGDDQMILLNKAAELADESIRIAAVKLLSRKKTPEVRELLLRLSNDPNETVRSLAEKTLQLLK
jgi:hypothetical protein